MTQNIATREIAAAPAETAAHATAAHAHSHAIDLIKGLAIVSVICEHTLSASTLSQLGGLFHIRQAVPVFLFLMGRNAASSLRRRGGRTLRELYCGEYLAARFDRVFVPFLVAFLLTLALAILTHTTHSGGLKLLGEPIVGVFPIHGPGNYFVTLLFEFVVVFPLVYWGLRRWPARTLLLCLALNAAFLEVAPRLAFFKTHPGTEGTCIVGSLFLVALGGVCAAVPLARALRSRWLWCGGLLSFALLVLLEADPAALSPAEASQASVLSACYPACAVLLGMAVLPAAGGAAARVGAVVGRASYHVFLVQIAWFGLLVVSTHSLLALVGNLAVTLSVGVVFYAAMGRAPLPSASRLLVRRRASLASQNVGA